MDPVSFHLEIRYYIAVSCYNFLWFDYLIIDNWSSKCNLI